MFVAITRLASTRSLHALLSVFFFFFNCTGDPRDLHSFPTRRSSDLGAGRRRDCRRGPGRASRPAPRHELADARAEPYGRRPVRDRKSTCLNSSHANISYAVFCLKKKKKTKKQTSTASRR